MGTDLLQIKQDCCVPGSSAIEKECEYIGVGFKRDSRKRYKGYESVVSRD